MRSLNLAQAVQYVHWAQPNDLDGLLQVAKAKVESLKLSIGKRSNQMPEHTDNAPTINVRAIVEFIEEVEPVGQDDEKPGKDDTDSQKKAKENLTKSRTDAQDKLVKLYATLLARCNASGYKPTEAPPAPEPAPLPPASPAPKALA